MRGILRILLFNMGTSRVVRENVTYKQEWLLAALIKIAVIAGAIGAIVWVETNRMQPFVVGPRLLDGTTISSPLDLITGRTEFIVITYWTSECEVCQRMMPELNAFYDRGDIRVLMVGINVGEGQNQVEKFIAEYKVRFPIIMGVETSPTGSVPLTAILQQVDGEWYLLKDIMGETTSSEILAVLREGGLR